MPSNNTEDDTFRILTQVPFQQMWNEYMVWVHSGPIPQSPGKEIDKLFGKLGWTWDEFMSRPEIPPKIRNL